MKKPIPTNPKPKRKRKATHTLDTILIRNFKTKTDKSTHTREKVDSQDECIWAMFHEMTLQGGTRQTLAGSMKK